MNYTHTGIGSNYSQEDLRTVGTPGETNQIVDAPPLIDHGIFTENSDLRAHVCFDIGGVYIFETQTVIDLILSGEYQKKPAFQNGVSGKTAEGYPIPVRDIDGVKFSHFPVKYSRDRLNALDGKSTSAKGDVAVQIVRRMIELGSLPVPLVSREAESVKIDIEGTDLIIVANLRIQVKCDFRGGCTSMGGTGNLYIQTAECNPRKMY